MVLRNKEDDSRKDKDEGRLCERCGGHRAGADGRDTDTVQQRTSHKLEKMQYKGENMKRKNLPNNIMML